MKRRPKLKSRYNERVEKAIEYALTIESWDDLVDPQTLAFYNLGPDPSSYVLRTLSIEEKKRVSVNLVRCEVFIINFLSCASFFFFLISIPFLQR